MRGLESRGIYEGGWANFLCRAPAAVVAGRHSRGGFKFRPLKERPLIDFYL